MKLLGNTNKSFIKEHSLPLPDEKSGYNQDGILSCTRKTHNQRLTDILMELMFGCEQTLSFNDTHTDGEKHQVVY